MSIQNIFTTGKMFIPFRNMYKLYIYIFVISMIVQHSQNLSHINECCFNNLRHELSLKKSHVNSENIHETNKIDALDFTQSPTKVYKTKDVIEIKKFADKKERVISRLFLQIKEIAKNLGQKYQESLNKILKESPRKIAFKTEMQKLIEQKQQQSDPLKQNQLQNYIQKIKQYLQQLDAQLKLDSTEFSINNKFTLEFINFSNKSYFQDLKDLQMILSGRSAITILQGLDKQQKLKQVNCQDFDFVGQISSFKKLIEYSTTNQNKIVITFLRNKFMTGMYSIQQDKWIQISFVCLQDQMDLPHVHIGNLKIFTPAQLLNKLQFSNLQSLNNLSIDQQKSFIKSFAPIKLGNTYYGCRLIDNSTAHDLLTLQILTSAIQNKQLNSKITKLMKKFNE